jgi:hypothetical protein
MNKGRKYRLPLRSSNKVETGLIFTVNDQDIRDRYVSMLVDFIHINCS